MSIKNLFKFFFVFLGIFLLYLLIGSIIPCLGRKPILNNTKEKISKAEYTSSNKESIDKAFIVETPEDALNIRLELVHNAKESLDILTYEITDSDSTRAFLGEILNAANRGVKVRLLLDGKSYFYSKNTSNFLNSLNSHENIECKVYNPVSLLKPWDLQFLLHDKIILVDEEYLLLGGRNIDERHFIPDPSNGSITHDRETFLWNIAKETVENPSGITQVKNYVNSLWSYEKTESIIKAGKDKYLDLLTSEVSAFKNSNPKFYKKTLEDFKNETLETSKVTLIHNPIEVEKKEPVVGYIMQQLALNSKESVVLQTPYSTGNKNLINTMNKVAGKVNLTMQTNSAASTPNIVAFSNYYGHRKKFIETGVQIYEYQSKDSIHGKSMVIDDRISIVGSFNMDDRSFYLDTETMLVIDSKPLAKQLSGHIKNLNDKSILVSKDNNYDLSSSTKEEDISSFKLFSLWAVYILLRPIQFLI